MPNKTTLAAAIMAILVLLDDWLGLAFLKQITEEWIMTLIAVLTPLVVWISGGGSQPSR